MSRQIASIIITGDGCYEQYTDGTRARLGYSACHTPRHRFGRIRAVLRVIGGTALFLGFVLGVLAMATMGAAL